MKKILPYFIIGILILGSVGAVGTLDDRSVGTQRREHQTISEPTITDTGTSEYVSIQLKESTGNLLTVGKPMIPVITKRYVFPLGTQITSVSVSFSDIAEHILTKKILPAPAPVPLTTDADTLTSEVTEAPEVYQTDALYPETRYSYSVHAGLEGTKHVMILNVRCHPIQYAPESNRMYVTNEMNLEINYQVPIQSTQFPDIYDLLIIAPKTFEKQLQPLIAHKENVGFNVTFATIESIVGNYGGRDSPEDIKLFIKESIEDYGISYVLLVGGMKSVFFGVPRDDANQGTRSWYVPVRYTNLYDGGSVQDPGYISDLYYADIYKVVDNQTVFEDWDSNGDGIFAKWSNLVGQTDEIDHYPDIYVGRLACRNTLEVKVMVDKIITYESSPADPSWFNRIIVVGGDSHDDTGTNFIEGEVVGDKALTFMTNFTPVKLYASNRDTGLGKTCSPENITDEISQGAGFVLFDGHGHPGSWNTHWPGVFSWSDTPGGISVNNFVKFSNRDKYPITLVGGCHNSQINVTLFATLLQKPMMWTHGIPVPECWSWWMTRKIGGGSIACFGSTGLGYGYVGNNSDIDGDGIDEPDTVEGLGGYTEVMFFKVYNSGVDILGDVWGTTITNYLDVFPPMGDKIQMKSIQEWPLIGDPTLKIGGYE
ncbi:MAG: hypothetical protein KKC68_03915 [Candidatus Thermoplasmatota archaeon]|nr:hypothetical protein [Candidatus Thermoplasmatota archaeon]MBU1940897.1 hypothetical protein [Candidatus Thermoplasmatota archaeon]